MTIHLQSCHHIPDEAVPLERCMQEYQQLTLVVNEEQKTLNIQNHKFLIEEQDFHPTMYSLASGHDGKFASQHMKKSRVLTTS
jgi:hypothetical protein